MILREDIQKFSDVLAEHFQPEKIILFGSYAYGTPTVDSDVDLLVIIPFEGHPAYKAVEILREVHPAFPLDLILRRPEEIERRYRDFDPIIRDALDEGVVLYERDCTRVA